MRGNTYSRRLVFGSIPYSHMRAYGSFARAAIAICGMGFSACPALLSVPHVTYVGCICRFTFGHRIPYLE